MRTAINLIVRFMLFIEIPELASFVEEVLGKWMNFRKIRRELGNTWEKLSLELLWGKVTKKLELERGSREITAEQYWREWTGEQIPVLVLWTHSVARPGSKIRNISVVFQLLSAGCPHIHLLEHGIFWRDFLKAPDVENLWTYRSLVINVYPFCSS